MTARSIWNFGRRNPRKRVLTKSILAAKLPAMNITFKLEEIDFAWDSDKAEANFQKHDVAFAEACKVFLDPFV